MKKRIAFHIRGIAQTIAVLIILSTVFIPWNKPQAYVSGGAGSISLSPSTTSIQTGTTANVDIVFKTAGVAVSGIQVQASFPVTGTELQVSQLQPNVQLAASGWTFAVSTVNTAAGKTTIQLMALNTSATGFTASTNTTLATLVLRANSAFSNKTITLDTTLSKMLKKSDATDMLGTLGNGSISASGNATTPAPTATPTPTPSQAAYLTSPTPTPTPPPTGGFGSAASTPNCTSLSSNITSATGTPQNITLTCSGNTSSGIITAAEFTFGDGTSQLVEQNTGASGSISISHTYTQIGSLGASCRVRDSNYAFSSTPSSCKTIITINPGTAVTASPTQSAGGGYGLGTTTTPTDTPIAGASPIAMVSGAPTTSPAGITSTFPTYPSTTPAGTAPKQSGSFPWWIIGGGLAIVGAVILFLRKKPTPPIAPPTSPPSPPTPPSETTGPQNPPVIG